MDDTGTFTYDSSLPTSRDRMRHTLGDTNPLLPLRWDETYDAALEFYGSEALATAKIARALAMQYAQMPTSVSIPGGPSVSWSERVKTWLDIAKQIEDNLPGGGVVTPGSYTQGVGYRKGMTYVDSESEYYSRGEWE